MRTFARVGGEATPGTAGTLRWKLLTNVERLCGRDASRNAPVTSRAPAADTLRRPTRMPSSHFGAPGIPSPTARITPMAARALHTSIARGSGDGATSASSSDTGEQLRAAQELARAIVRSAHSGIVAFDVEKRFTLWNGVMERLYEIEAGEVLGNTFAEKTAQFRVRGLDDVYDAALRGETVEVKRRAIVGHKTGRISLVDATYAPLLDAEHRVVGGVGMLRDVTDDMRDQLHLERLSAVAQQTNEGVLMTDASGRIVWANAAWESLTGWNVGEVVGRFPGDLLRGGSADPIIGDRIARAVMRGEAFNEEILNQHRDGTPFWMSIRATPILDAQGVVTGYVAIERDVTEAREEERKLRAERAFAASLISANSDGIFAVDLDFNVTEWNSTLEQWSGLLRSDVIGQSMDAVIPLADSEFRHRRFAQLFIDGRSFSQARSYRFPGSDRELQVETVVTPIRDLTTREITGALCTIRDVSDRIAAAERFRVLFEQASEAHLILDGSVIVDCNEAAVRMLRAADKQSVLGLTPVKLSPDRQPNGRSSASLARKWSAQARRGGRARFDWMHRRMDGTEFPVEVNLNTIRLEEGPAIVVTWHDLTERAAAEHAIRRERERLLDAIGALDAGFAMFDAKERLVAFNGRFRNGVVKHVPDVHVGMPLETILESMLIDGKHPATGRDGAQWKAGVLGRHREGGGVAEETSKRGTMRVSISRTRDGGSVSLFTDITELKAVQSSLEQARDAANEASRAKSEFLARMSHELRTPLNSIIGFSRQVLKELHAPLHARDRQYLERVLHNGTQLLSLINDILDLSKIEAGRMEVVIAPTDLRALVSETIGMFEGQTRAPMVELCAKIPDRLSLVDTDESMLRQVMVNLVGNALKFTRRGSVEVVVETDAQHRPRAIVVSDTGIGIPPDRLEAVFGAFEQANTTTSRTYGGTGLGLAISRSVCALLGLEMTVQSKVEEGTTFRIAFPLGTLANSGNS